MRRQKPSINQNTMMNSHPHRSIHAVRVTSEARRIRLEALQPERESHMWRTLACASYGGETPAHRPGSAPGRTLGFLR